jgi:hypothetical protein
MPKGSLRETCVASRNAKPTALCWMRKDSPPLSARGIQYLEAAGIHRGLGIRRMRRGDILTAERLSDQSVALIVKRRAADAGIRSEELATLSGHSLRAGYVTAAAATDV